MKTGLSAGLAIWAAVVAWFVMTELTGRTMAPSAPASQAAPAPPVAAPTELHNQMNALDRRARIDMLLYRGHLGGRGVALKDMRLDVVGLTMPAR